VHVVQAYRKTNHSHRQPSDTTAMLAPKRLEGVGTCLLASGAELGGAVQCPLIARSRRGRCCSVDAMTAGRWPSHRAARSLHGSSAAGAGVQWTKYCVHHQTVL
jgi:hypothetical protein